MPARVKRPRHLHAAKRTVFQQSSVLAGERNALRHGLIDDVNGELRQTIDIRLAGPVVATFHRVVKEAINAVAVVLVVFRGIDAALRGNRMRTARRVVEDEAFDVVTQLAEGGRSRGARQSRTDDDDVVFAFVRRIDQFVMRLGVFPFIGQLSGRNLRFQLSHRTTPVNTAMGKETLARVMINANAEANTRRHGLNFVLLPASW